MFGEFEFSPAKPQTVGKTLNFCIFCIRVLKKGELSETARAKKRHPLLSQEVLVAWRVQTTRLDQLNQVSDQVKSNFAISNLDISSNPITNVVSLFLFQIIGSHFQTCEMITRCSPSCLEGLNNMLTFFSVCVCFFRPVSHPHLPK